MKNDLSKCEIIEYSKEILNTKIKDIPNLYVVRDPAIPYTYVWKSKSIGMIQKKGINTIFFSLSSGKDPGSSFWIIFKYDNMLICVKGKVKVSVDHISVFDLYRGKKFDNFENLYNESTLLEIIRRCNDKRRGSSI